MGLELFHRFGAEQLGAWSQGCHSFWDLKFHDIPNTVQGAVASLLAEQSPNLLTVHASGGSAMLEAVAKLQTDAPRFDIAAVSVLTSLNESDANAVFGASSLDVVERLANLTAASGCKALVCSGQEVAQVKAAHPDLWTVVPGIRLAGSDAGDQARVLTPREARKRGADSLVIGRSITAAASPQRAIEAALAEIAEADALREQGG